MAVNPDEAQSLQKITATKRRRLRELEQQAAVYGISTPPQVSMEIRDLREQLGIVDLIATSGETWTGLQVQVLVYTLSIAYTERWNDQERHNRGQDHNDRIIIGLLIAVLVALIVLTITVLLRGGIL